MDIQYTRNDVDFQRAHRLGRRSGDHPRGTDKAIGVELLATIERITEFDVLTGRAKRAELRGHLPGKALCYYRREPRAIESIEEELETAQSPSERGHTRSVQA